jgi:hypothetical protein
MKTHSAIPLADAQQTALATAIERSDSACSLPDRNNRRAAQKLATSLIEKGLVREVRAKAGMPIWRQDDADRSLMLIITKRGRDAVRASAETTGQDSKPLDTAGGPGTVSELRQAPRDGAFGLNTMTTVDYPERRWTGRP